MLEDKHVRAAHQQGDAWVHSAPAALLTHRLPLASDLHGQVDKKKMWEEVQPLLRTDGGRVAGFAGRPMMTSAGAVTAPSLADARIS